MGSIPFKCVLSPSQENMPALEGRSDGGRKAGWGHLVWWQATSGISDMLFVESENV